MGEKTEITWATHTFNPWIGCTKVSPACANCYAERERDHRFGQVLWGPNGTRRMTADWRKPLKWNRDAEAAYRDVCDRYPMPHQPDPRHFRPRVFCASLADVFEDWQGLITSHDGDHVYRCQECGLVGLWPVIRDNCPGCAKPGTKVHASMSDLRGMLFTLIDSTPWLDWLLLTKRPDNIRHMWSRCTRCKGNGRIEMLEHCPLCRGQGMEPRRENVWLGTSVENQNFADTRMPQLLSVRHLAPRLFLSCEPLLGPVELGLSSYRTSFDWLITGGESGPKARPSHPDWFRSLRNQCQVAGVPFHFKQWGEWAPYSKDNRVSLDGSHFGAWIDGAWYSGLLSETPGPRMQRIGKKAAGRLLDGVEHNGFPTPASASA